MIPTVYLFLPVSAYFVEENFLILPSLHNPQPQRHFHGLPQQRYFHHDQPLMPKNFLHIPFKILQRPRSHHQLIPFDIPFRVLHHMLIPAQPPEILFLFLLDRRHLISSSQHLGHRIDPIQTLIKVLNLLRLNKYIPRKQP